MSGSINWTARHAAAGCDFFRERIPDPDAIHTLDDLKKLPLTTKEELREAYPFGWTCVALDQVVRIHASSGTTGRRIVASYTLKDLADWADMFARCYEFAGVTPADRVQITPGYGLWTAGIGFQAGVERLGAMSVPTGPGNLDLQFEMMLDFSNTVICATSSFGLLMAEEAARRGLSETLSLRVAILGSERWGDAMRQRIEKLLGVETFDIYGFTELYGPGTGIDCGRHEGIHCWDDYYVIEVIDPASGRVLPAGEEGELVVTSLRKEAQPLVRYRTHDISSVYPEPCGCGSPYPRIARLTGRSDDLFKVRGVQVYPAMVDTALARIEGAGSEYQVLLTREEGRDRMLVRVEVESATALEVGERLRAALGVRPDVEVVPLGTLPRTEGKTKRGFDERV